MLDIRNVSKSYAGPAGPVRALVDVSLHVGSGEFVAVRGPSGSGKTTLLLAAGGMLRPDRGHVVLGGQDLYQLSAERRARLRASAIGFVFQQFHLVPYLSVLDNILAPALAQPGRQLRERALELAGHFGLSHRLGHVPGALSSGERQRAALARALLHRPGLILADEPTGNLDDHNGRVVLDSLADYATKGGALLLVTHDSRAAERAKRVIELSVPAAGTRSLP